MSTVQSEVNTDLSRWQAIRERDRSQDGAFVYAVTTTGVFCRPSCPSRLPRPEHVRYFDGASGAEGAGFRPCKRCRPTQQGLDAQHASMIERACRIIQEADERIGLEELAARIGMSPYHFHRVFKRLTGLTPRAYADAHRQQHVRTLLQGHRKVTDAIQDAGFSSSSRFYEKSNRSLGMNPRSFGRGGAHSVIRFAVAQTSLGSVLIAATERGVCAVEFGEPEQLVRNLQDRFHRAELIGADAKFEKLVARVLGQIERPRQKSNLPLDIQGTAFQQKVWTALRAIPAGDTASYTEVAKRIGQPTATRAVAQACGANKIAVLIPCHRVVRNDASLSGYRWGVDRKRALLDRESK